MNRSTNTQIREEFGPPLIVTCLTYSVLRHSHSWVHLCFYSKLIWLSSTTSAHHNAARIVTSARWSAQTAAWNSLESLRFSPSPLKSDTPTHYQNRGLSPLCCAPAEWKPWSYVGFWVACVCFRGIMVQLWNKEGGMNLISLQCHTNSHVFHTLGCLLPLTPTSAACANLFWAPSSP